VSGVSAGKTLFPTLFSKKRAGYGAAPHEFPVSSFIRVNCGGSQPPAFLSEKSWAKELNFYELRLLMIEISFA